MRALSIDARYRVVRNLAPNPSFEVDVTPWSRAGSSTLTRDATVADVGTASAKLVAAVNGAQFITTGSGASRIPVQAGAITIGWSAKTDQDAHTNLAIIEYRADGGTNAVQWSPNVATVAGVWKRSQITFTLNATTVLLLVQIGDDTAHFGTTSRPIGSAMWIDRIWISPDLPDYADGDSSNWRWDGAPGASTSRGLVFVP